LDDFRPWNVQNLAAGGRHRDDEERSDGGTSAVVAWGAEDEPSAAGQRGFVGPSQRAVASSSGGPRGRQPPRAGAGAAATPGGDEGRALSELLCACCVALGRGATEGDAWAQRLRAEWISGPPQLRGLSAEEWSRLGLPVGLEAEVRRRLGQMAPPAAALPPQGAGRPHTARRHLKVVGAALRRCRAPSGGPRIRPGRLSVLLPVPLLAAILSAPMTLADFVGS